MSAASTIDILFRAAGQMTVERAVDGIKTGFSSMGDTVKRISGAVVEELKGIESEAKNADRTLEGAGKKTGFGVADREAKALIESLKRVGQEGGLERASQNAERLGAKIDGAKEKYQGLSDLAEKSRNAGVGMALAGGAGVMLSNDFVQTYREGEGAQDKMDAMLKKQGEGDKSGEMTEWTGKLAYDAAMTDDDPLKEATAGLQGFGMKTEYVKGLMPGLIGQTRLYGNSLDSVSEAVGRAFAKGDPSALARIGVTLTEDQKKRMKDLSASGADMATKQAAMYTILKESFDKYALSMTEGLSESEISANRLALKLDDVKTNIGAGSAAAQMSLGNVSSSLLNIIGANQTAQYSFGWLLTMGSYGLTAAGSLLSLGSQAAMTGMALKAMGFSGIAGFRAMAASALSAAPAIWGAMAPVLAVIASIAAVALIAAAAIYALDKAWHWKEDRELAANIAKGDDTSVKLLDIQNKRRAKKGLPQLTMDEFQGDPDEDFKKLHEDEASPSGAGDIDKMQSRLEAARSGKMVPVAPSFATAGASAALAPVSDDDGEDDDGGEGDEPAATTKVAKLKAPKKPRATRRQPRLTPAKVAQIDPNAGLMAFLMKGGSIANFKPAESTPTKAAESKRPARGGKSSGVLELAEVGRTQMADGDEIDVKGKLKLTGERQNMRRMTR